MNHFYITTPIYYVNDKPHVGTAYSTVLADILNRYHQFFNKQTFFLTGVDEHGQKCQQVAELKNLDPQIHCDQMAKEFQIAWKALDIQYNHFYRTTSSSHKQSVQKALQKLFDQGYIYESIYEGWYSVSEEIFYTEKDLINGLSPQKKEVVKIKEKNYFFKMSQFQERLIQHIQSNPHFIYPENRKNEVLGFLHQGLDDLCISRPKSRLKWGVELPFDKNYVSYVWIDALLNYVFAVGLWKSADFDQWWKECTHLLGKDILITHGVYWPCLLMALDVNLPKQMISHGWLLNKDQEKMSKSKGDVLSPVQLVNDMNADILRYFFAKAVRLGQDALISKELIVKEYNQDLADNLGNLLQRVSALIANHFDARIPEPSAEIFEIQTKALEVYKNCPKQIDRFLIHQHIADVMMVLKNTNQLLEQKTPWKLVKTSPKEAGFILYAVLDVIRICTILLYPVIPSSAKQILNRLHISDFDFQRNCIVNGIKKEKNIHKETPVFPKILN